VQMMDALLCYTRQLSKHSEGVPLLTASLWVDDGAKAGLNLAKRHPHFRTTTQLSHRKLRWPKLC